jgi:hypothetical protein
VSIVPLDRLRRLCLALPGAHEVEAWGEPTFRVRNKLFAMHASPGNHHGGGRPAVWMKAAPGNQALMVQAVPARFFIPPYVGPSGWVGVWLDGSDVDWHALADLLADSHRLIAPKRLLRAAALAPRPGTPGRHAAAMRASSVASSHASRA